MADVLVLEIGYRGSRAATGCDCFIRVYGDDQTLMLTHARAVLPSNGVDLAVFVRGVAKPGQDALRQDRAVRILEAIDPVRTAAAFGRREIEKGIADEEVIDLRADAIAIQQERDGAWSVVREGGQSPITVTGDWGPQRVTPERRE